MRCGAASHGGPFDPLATDGPRGTSSPDRRRRPRCCRRPFGGTFGTSVSMATSWVGAARKTAARRFRDSGGSRRRPQPPFGRVDALQIVAASATWGFVRPPFRVSRERRSKMSSTNYSELSASASVSARRGFAAFHEQPGVEPSPVLHRRPQQWWLSTRPNRSSDVRIPRSRSQRRLFRPRASRVR